MADGGDDNVFVYMGGDQVVPDEITHTIIDQSVTIVRRRAFKNRRQLVSVIFHDGVEIVEEEAFQYCKSLSGIIKLLGVREIGDRAFEGCFDLSGVEFGDRLETIRDEAFRDCRSLRSVKSLSVRTIRRSAFNNCCQLIDAEFGIDLETVGNHSFYNCFNLQRITIPLKDNMFPIVFNYDDSGDDYRYTQFDRCDKLTTIELVGAERIQNTISSLFMERWRYGMSELFGSINRELPNTNPYQKTDLIRFWINEFINGMERCKAGHNRFLKEHMTLLELAIWKAKLDEKDGDSTLKGQGKRVKIDTASARNEQRITSGADTIIKNVLPFLRLA